MNRAHKAPACGRRVVADFTIFGLLVGATLALHFRMFVLVPVIPLTLAVVAVGDALHGETILWITPVLAATSVQMGYLTGGILQFAVEERSR